MLLKLFLPFILILVSSSLSFSQGKDIQTVEYVRHNNRYYAFASGEVKKIYCKELLNSYSFLNGKEYKIYDIGRRTSPLFGSSFGLKGTIFTNGEAFRDITLVYDINKDALIYITPSQIFNNSNFIEINRAVVDSFYIEVKTSPQSGANLKSGLYIFTKVNFAEKGSGSMEDGYYEVANMGKIQLLVQHKAIIVSNQGADALQNGLYKYVHSLNKFICLNGNYYEINKMRKFIKLFPGKRKDIKMKLRYYATPFDKLNTHQLADIIKHINSI